MIWTFRDGLEQLDMEQADLLDGFAAGKDLATLARGAHRSDADTARVLGDALQYLGKRLWDQGRRAATEERWRVSDRR